MSTTEATATPLYTEVQCFLKPNSSERCASRSDKRDEERLLKHARVAPPDLAGGFQGSKGWTAAKVGPCRQRLQKLKGLGFRV